ncbi:hypothetical protein GCM10023080_082730 [Streptomyces pseudoechinosporeus]
MTSAPVRHDFPVISTPGHVPLARHETAKVLTDWGLPDELVDTSCLIITELVTNVVRHASVVSPTATVTLAVDETGNLVLTVADAHPFKPRPLMAAHDFGGRDAAIWLTAVEYAREHPEETVYFVSRNTKDFGDGTAYPPLMDQDLEGPWLTFGGD